MRTPLQESNHYVNIPDLAVSFRSWSSTYITVVICLDLIHPKVKAKFSTRSRAVSHLVQSLNLFEKLGRLKPQYYCATKLFFVFNHKLLTVGQATIVIELMVHKTLACSRTTCQKIRNRKSRNVYRNASVQSFLKHLPLSEFWRWPVLHVNSSGQRARPTRKLSSYLSAHGSWSPRFWRQKRSIPSFLGPFWVSMRRRSAPPGQADWHNLRLSARLTAAAVVLVGHHLLIIWLTKATGQVTFSVGKGSNLPEVTM